MALTQTVVCDRPPPDTPPRGIVPASGSHITRIENTHRNTRETWVSIVSRAMGDKIGYARVSTADQDPQLQLDALAAENCLKVYIDTATGNGGRSGRSGRRA
jgi:hypothetical protein